LSSIVDVVDEEVVVDFVGILRVFEGIVGGSSSSIFKFVDCAMAETACEKESIMEGVFAGDDVAVLLAVTVAEERFE